MKQLITTILAAIFFMPLFAQDETPSIVTDRPDQTESAVTVPQKTFQIETGLFYEWDNDDDMESSAFNYNNTLLRYGLLSRFEFRLGFGFTAIENKINDIEEEELEASEDGEDATYSDVKVGLKWNVLKGDGPIPTLAFLTHVVLPRNMSEKESGNTLQTMRLAGSWTLSNVFSFGFNLGTIIDWEEEDHTPFYTASLGASITDWMGAFVEFYGYTPVSEYASHLLDFGFTFPVRHNLQIDVTGGVGLTSNAPDGFVSAGLAWRIPR